VNHRIIILFSSQCRMTVSVRVVESLHALKRRKLYSTVMYYEGREKNSINNTLCENKSVVNT